MKPNVSGAHAHDRAVLVWSGMSTAVKASEGRVEGPTKPRLDRRGQLSPQTSGLPAANSMVVPFVL